MPRIHPAAFAGAFALVLAALVAPPATAATVQIDNFRFEPATLSVEPGATVVWVNHDDAPHTVVATDRAFQSNVMDTDESFSFTFTKPGEYAYFCSLHPHMVGKVVVKAPAGVEAGAD